MERTETLEQISRTLRFFVITANTIFLVRRIRRYFLRARHIFLSISRHESPSLFRSKFRRRREDGRTFSISRFLRSFVVGWVETVQQITGFFRFKLFSKQSCVITAIKSFDGVFRECIRSRECVMKETKGVRGGFVRPIVPVQAWRIE